MDEKPMYNSTGWPVGWLVGDVLYDLDGKARAFVKGEALFSYESEHLGGFSEGFLRDSAGDPVAFIDSAQGGPDLPETLEPVRALPALQEPPPQPEAEAEAGVPASQGSTRWSELAFNSLLVGWPPGKAWSG